MARTAAPRGIDRKGTNPLVIVLGTLLTVVAVTALIYTVADYEGPEGLEGGGTANLAGPAPIGACGQSTPADSSYTADLVATPNPPRPEGTNFLMTVRQDGRAITGAKVCLTADMPEMQHPGLNVIAREGAGGRYDARLQFGMGGTWKAWVTIAEQDKPVVAVPMTIEVMPVQPN